MPRPVWEIRKGDFKLYGEAADEYVTHYRASLYKHAEHARHNRLYGGYEYGDPKRLPAIAEEVRLRIHITKREIFTIGELLYEAKKILQGEFKQWIEDNFDFGYDTANNFMNVYKHLFGHRGLVDKVKSSILYRISAPSFPDELREYLISQGGLRDITGRKLDTFMKKYKEGGIDAIQEDFEKMTEGFRLHEQISYTLDLIEMASRELIKLKQKIETQDPVKHKPLVLGALDSINQSQVGTKIMKDAFNVIDGCIDRLSDLHQSSRVKMHDAFEPYRKELGDKKAENELFDEATGEWKTITKVTPIKPSTKRRAQA